MDRVIIAHATNRPPQEEVNRALADLDPGWKIVCANTAMMPVGQWTASSAMDMQTLNVPAVTGDAMHVHFCTTIVLRKI